MSTEKWHNTCEQQKIMGEVVGQNESLDCCHCHFHIVWSSSFCFLAGFTFMGEQTKTAERQTRQYKET